MRQHLEGLNHERNGIGHHCPSPGGRSAFHLLIRVSWVRTPHGLLRVRKCGQHHSCRSAYWWTSRDIRALVAVANRMSLPSLPLPGGNSSFYRQPRVGMTRLSVKCTRPLLWRRLVALALSTSHYYGEAGPRCRNYVSGQGRQMRPTFS